MLLNITPPTTSSQEASPTEQALASPIPPQTGRLDRETSSALDPTLILQREQIANLSREDWGEAPHIENLCGREKELNKLEKWIISEHCRLVVVLGMGGIGKTVLTAKLVERIKGEFEYVFWRELKNAPSVEIILKNCIQFLSNQQVIDLPKDIDSQIALLIEYLRDHRCLLVLDNIETVLAAGNFAGQYRQEYEGYRKLIRRLGEAKHQSCLLLVSWEKPQEIVHLEGADVRPYLLTGVGYVEAQQLLKDKQLFGTDEEWKALVDLYSGNPLALKLAAAYIRYVCKRDIAVFLKEGEAVFGDIRNLLDQHFQRLSELEQELMYWLAIEREPVSLDILQKDLVRSVLPGQLLEAISSLHQRSMIEITDTRLFTLQPVIMEYFTGRLIEQISEEIESEKIRLFASYALMKAQGKDYVRDTQVRLVLTPIVDRLLNSLGKEGIEKKFKNILSTLREKPPNVQGYAAGNVLNLLVRLESELGNYDFSHLLVRQAYLPGVNLSDINFAYADLATSVFADTFGTILSTAFSSDGELLATGTTRGEIRLWQATTGTPLYTYYGHTDWVRSVAFNPDGRLLASGSEDQSVRLWEVSTGKCLQTLQGHSGRVYSVAFSPDRRLLASGSEDQSVRLWEVSTGRLLKTRQGHTHRVRSVAFSPDGRLVASGSEDQSIRLWEVSTGQLLKTLQGHTNWIWSVAFSPDGRLLASGNED